MGKSTVQLIISVLIALTLILVSSQSRHDALLQVLSQSLPIGAFYAVNAVTSSTLLLASLLSSVCFRSATSERCQYLWDFSMMVTAVLGLAFSLLVNGIILEKAGGVLNSAYLLVYLDVAGLLYLIVALCETAMKACKYDKRTRQRQQEQGTEMESGLQQQHEPGLGLCIGCGDRCVLGSKIKGMAAECCAVHLYLAFAVSTILILTNAYGDLQLKYESHGQRSVVDASFYGANSVTAVLLFLVAVLTYCWRNNQQKLKHGCTIVCCVLAAIGFCVALYINCEEVQKIRGLLNGYNIRQKELIQDSANAVANRNRPYKYVDFPKSHRGVSEVEMFIYALIFLDAVGLFHLIVTFVNKVKRARQAARELQNNTKTTQDNEAVDMGTGDQCHTVTSLQNCSSHK